MRGRPGQSESEGSPGAPEWMVTFSDCMTLLLTFFVLLLSFSSFDNKEFRRLRSVLTGSFASIDPFFRRNKDAFLEMEQITPTKELKRGSEKPTLESGKENNILRDTQPDNFRKLKVFVIPSASLFWGKGTTISRTGRRILSALGLFLREVPNRVVISETGTSPEGSQDELGLERSWVILEYLANSFGLDRGRFSISSSSVLAQEGCFVRHNDLTRGGSERRIEIVLLDKGICN